MKRPIKFRAWDGKKMLQNVGTHPHMIKSLIKMPNCDNQDSDCEYKKDDEGAYIISQAFDAYTLMQFTGLKDKNGKEVYEGDIRREEIEMDEGDQREYYVCVWINEWSMFAWLYLPGEYYNYLDNGAEHLDTVMYWTYPASKDEESKIIVCGNIYQNPELLK